MWAYNLSIWDSSSAVNLVFVGAVFIQPTYCISFGSRVIVIAQICEPTVQQLGRLNEGEIYRSSRLSIITGISKKIEWYPYSSSCILRFLPGHAQGTAVAFVPFRQFSWQHINKYIWPASLHFVEYAGWAHVEPSRVGPPCLYNCILGINDHLIDYIPSS
jgi:hypothetical protein